MSVNLTVNGITYSFPTLSDKDWGLNVTAWATAITAGILPKAGGTFLLSGEVDFGGSYGLKSIYFKSRSSNIASAGQIRLARADVISWRNQANAANLDLAVSTGNRLLFNSVQLMDTSDFTDAAVTSKVLTGYISGAGTISAADTILTAINKLDGNIGTKLSAAGFTDAAVTGKLITGYTPGAGTVAGTDTILEAINKICGNISAGGVNYTSRGDASAYDFTWSTIPSQTENAWHELDLSSIIPSGAASKLVHLAIVLDSNVNGIKVYFSENGYVNNINVVTVKQVTALAVVYANFTVKCDASRKIQYKLDDSGPGHYNNLDIVVRGWWA